MKGGARTPKDVGEPIWGRRPRNESPIRKPPPRFPVAVRAYPGTRLASANMRATLDTERRRKLVDGRRGADRRTWVSPFGGSALESTHPIRSPCSASVVVLCSRARISLHPNCICRRPRNCRYRNAAKFGGWKVGRGHRRTWGEPIWRRRPRIDSPKHNSLYRSPGGSLWPFAHTPAPGLHFQTSAQL